MLAKENERTNSKMLIFCIVLICAHIIMTFNRYPLDRWQKVTFETCFTCTKRQIPDFSVSQGNAATYLRCGRKTRPNMGFVENLSLFAAAKEFCKSIKKWQSYSHVYGGTVFWLTVYKRNVYIFSVTRLLDSLWLLRSQCALPWWSHFVVFTDCLILKLTVNDDNFTQNVT